VCYQGFGCGWWGEQCGEFVLGVMMNDVSLILFYVDVGLLCSRDREC
jgi:hypothetical protein